MNRSLDYAHLRRTSLWMTYLVLCNIQGSHFNNIRKSTRLRHLLRQGYAGQEDFQPSSAYAEASADYGLAQRRGAAPRQLDDSTIKELPSKDRSSF
jgi:hypothetical protein